MPGMVRLGSQLGSTGSRLSGHWALLASVWLSAFLVSTDYTALTVALPTLAADLNVGTSEVSWTALAYMLAVASLTLVTGPVIDRLGYGRALSAALALFAVASLASAVAPTFWLLVALRVAQGVGASVMLVIGPAIIKTKLPAETHDRAFAIFSTGPTAGLCAGPAIGGQLTAQFGWQSVFLFNVPAALLALLLLGLAARSAVGRDEPTPGRQVRFPNPIAAVLAITGVLALLLALNQGKEWGWTSNPILALFAASAVILLAFALLERRAAVPLIDRRIFQSRDFSASAAAFLCVLIVFGGGVFLLPFYFQWLRKLDTFAVGHLLMVQPIASIVVSNLSAACLSGLARRTLCFAGIPLFAAGAALFAIMDRDAPLLLPIIALSLMGTGAGLYYPALIQVGMAGISARLAASAASLQAAIRVLAQMLGVVLFETLFSQLYPLALDALRAPMATGDSLERMLSAFQVVFTCSAAIAALAIMPVFVLSRHRKPVAAPITPMEGEGT